MAVVSNDHTTVAMLARKRTEVHCRCIDAVATLAMGEHQGLSHNGLGMGVARAIDIPGECDLHQRFLWTPTNFPA
eukprot:11121496-Lingulodinium_polyedra.AAC.1